MRSDGGRPWLFGVILCAACNRCGEAQPTPDGATTAASVVQSASASPSTASTPSVAPTTSTSPSASAAQAPLGDGGAPCPVALGPKQLAFTGPAALTANGDGVDVVFLVAGAPKVVHEPTPRTGDSAKETTVAATTATDPGCAAAGLFAFCMDRDGAIQRTPLAGGASIQVGKGKPGTRLAAASAGGETVCAFLADRKTSEGVTSEAWLVGVTTPLTRISDEGAGATFVAVAPAGADKMVALYIDGRRGMAPIHGVGLAVRGGKATREKDDVLFVAGGAETFTAGALATTADGHATALVPIAHDVGFGLLVTRFGVASDEHWTDYDNGLDPAPIAATTLASGDPWAVRVAPAGKKFGAPRVLELGRVTDQGFSARGVIATHGDPRAVALTLDPGGALTVVFSDASGTWLERLRCP